MDAKLLIINVLAVVLLIALSGCIDQQATTIEESSDNIKFDSDVVELYAANLEFIKDEEEFDARSVELKYALRNPLEKAVSVVVDILFYDENGREIHSEMGYTITLPAGYTESGMNTVSYAGSMVNNIDNVHIIAYEK